MNLDFTLEKYRDLCRCAIESKYEIKTVCSHMRNPAAEGRILIVRHDVDRLPEKALRMAKLEQSLGIKTTYYFRMTSGSYKTHIIKEIADMGHEIGYHYEVLDKAKGDYDLAMRLFKQELEKFRQIATVETICMHGNPLTKWVNKDLWKEYNFTDYGLIGEPYLSIDYTRFVYFSDSGRIWSNNTWRKTKDIVCSSQHHMEPRNTDDLVKIIKGGELRNICILTHPERWSKGILDYSKSYVVDMAYLAGKLMIHGLRNK